MFSATSGPLCGRPKGRICAPSPYSPGMAFRTSEIPSSELLIGDLAPGVRIASTLPGINHPIPMVLVVLIAFVEHDGFRADLAGASNACLILAVNTRGAKRLAVRERRAYSYSLNRTHH